MEESKNCMNETQNDKNLTEKNLLEKLSAAAGDSAYARALMADIENFPAEGYPIDEPSIRYWLYEKQAYEQDWQKDHERERENEKAYEDAGHLEVITHMLKVLSA